MQGQQKLYDNIMKLKNILDSTKGKKVYKFLKPEAKTIVDSITQQICRNKDIQSLYEQWCNCQKDRIGIYTSKIPDFPSLEDNPEFKTIKNHIIRAVAEMSDIIEIQSDKIRTENPVFENIPLPDNPPIVHENDENIKEVINKQTADTEENLKEETAPTIDPAVGGIAISLFGQLTRMMTQDSNIDQSQFVNHSVETEILRKVLERKLAQGQKIE